MVAKWWLWSWLVGQALEDQVTMLQADLQEREAHIESLTASLEALEDRLAGQTKVLGFVLFPARRRSHNQRFVSFKGLFNLCNNLVRSFVVLCPLCQVLKWSCV